MGAAARSPLVSFLRPAILDWYRRHRRDLPWRRTSDPYAIWVAEVMLQQTQVSTVLPYYARFLQRFPECGCLARASEEEVLGAWSGLGYYRRARALREGARRVDERYGGRLPGDARKLRELPGIGRYTAGAIASIAFDLPEPVLDGNVRRVLARIFAVDGKELGRGAEERRLWDLAGRLVQGPNPGDLNQGLMELGATVCLPRNPECRRCPISRRCMARASGEPQRFPVPRSPRATERVVVAVAVVWRGERFLLERPAAESPFRGTWDLPGCSVEGQVSCADALRGWLSRRHGVEIEVGPWLGRARHGIMNRSLRLEIHECRVRRGGVTGRASLRWAHPGQLRDMPISGATRKVLRLASDHSRS